MRTIIMTVVLTLAPLARAQDPDPRPADDAAAEDASLPQDTTDERLQVLEARLAERERLIDWLLQREAQADTAKPPAAARHGTTDPTVDFEAWSARDKMIPYREGMAIGPIYERRNVPRRAGMITGGSLLGSAYLISTLVAALDADVDERNTLNGLYVPVVGPWIGMIVDGQRGDLSPGGGWGLAALGVMQATGLGVLAWSATHPRDMLVKRPFGVTSVDVTPQQGGAAMSVTGRF